MGNCVSTGSQQNKIFLLHQAVKMAKEDEARTFPKLKGSDNYKEWAREMEFALKQVGLMGLVNCDRIRPLPHTEEQKEAILKKDEDERIEKREEAIEKWDLI